MARIATEREICVKRKNKYFRKYLFFRSAHFFLFFRMNMWNLLLLLFISPIITSDAYWIFPWHYKWFQIKYRNIFLCCFVLFISYLFMFQTCQTSSPDIAPSDYYLFKNLKAFLRGKNFYSDDEVITTVEEHLNNLGSGFFFDGIQSLYNRWQRVVASEGYYIQ